MSLRPYLTHEYPIRFAHRGSRILWPENTMPAFQGAVDLGYQYIETDVHVSRDGRVVVFHDDRLERLTDGRGRTWDHDWDHLRTLDAGHHFNPGEGHPMRGRGAGIPLLEEVVRAFPEQLFNLDLKQPGIEEAVAEEIRRLGVEERVLIGSFYDRRIRRFRTITEGRVATSAGPREVTAALVGLRGARRSAADAYQVPLRAGPVPVATRRLLRAAEDAGKHVHVWTVNDEPTMHTLLDLGVDGIVTDRPDLLNEVIAERAADR